MLSGRHMKKNSFVRCLTAALCLAAACLTGNAGEQVRVPTGRPNVLLIVCDDLNDYTSGL